MQSSVHLLGTSTPYAVGLRQLKPLRLLAADAKIHMNGVLQDYPKTNVQHIF